MTVWTMIQYCLPNNIILLVTIDKFNPSLLLVDINKLKLYWFVEDSTLQRIFVKPNDLLPKELLETNKFCNLFTKEIVEMNTNDLLMKELVEMELDIPITIYTTSPNAMKSSWCTPFLWKLSKETMNVIWSILVQWTS